MCSSSPASRRGRAVCLSGNRFSPDIGDGTDIYGSEGTIHIASETLNPFHAAPLAVYTEKAADDLPEVLREAHYPDAWWKTFKGGWITVKPPRRSPYRAQMRAFCRQHRRGPPGSRHRRGRAEGAGAVQGAYLAMATGGWVDLPLAADAPFLVPSY